MSEISLQGQKISENIDRLRQTMNKLISQRDLYLKAYENLLLYVTHKGMVINFCKDCNIEIVENDDLQCDKCRLLSSDYKDISNNKWTFGNWDDTMN